MNYYELPRLNPYWLPDLRGLVSNKERILVLGAGGWFGQTFLNMSNNVSPTLLIGTTRRGGMEIWSEDVIKNFEPTIVLNFAFITRNKLSIYGREKFISTNLELIEKMKFCGELKTVRQLLTVSSGASLSPQAQTGLDSIEIYGALKKFEEQVAASLISNKRSVVILRAYSVSGPYNRKAQEYAFTSFVNQALQYKKIHITAEKKVYRRYISVGDFLSVGLIRSFQGWSGVIESGGTLVELGELASLVASLLGVDIEERNIDENSDVDCYFSDNKSWSSQVQELGLTPLNLTQQITSTAQFFRALDVKKQKG